MPTADSHGAPALDGAGGRAYTAGNRRPRRPAHSRWPAGFPFKWIALLCCAALLLAGCEAGQPTPTNPPPAAAPSSQPQPDHTATSESTNSVVAGTAAPTLQVQRSGAALPSSCHGTAQLLADSVESDGLARPLPYSIYLPPCYVHRPGDDYPTLYLLHGLNRSDQQWISLGLLEQAQALMTGGEVNPYLIVMPWHRAGIELEPALLNYLIPHIQDRYRARDDGNWRAIGGISRGGAWAFRIGFRHPDHFRAVGLHSPGLFGGDLFAVERWLEQQPDATAPQVWIDVGDRDSLRATSSEIVARLEELGVEYEYDPGSGWHDEEYWRANLQRYLRWYGDLW